MRRLLPVSILLFTLIACDPSPNSDYRRYVVVESHMVAQNYMPPVLLSWSQPVDQRYDFDEAALHNAAVRIELLNDEGVPTHLFPYEMIRPGIYMPEIWILHRVQPGRTYRLTADIPSFGRVTGQTSVPDTFRVVGPVPQSVTYQRDTLRIRISNPSNGDRQNVYLFQTTADDIRLENMTPFYRSLVEDGDSDVEEFTNNSSTPINESNFRVTDDGLIELQFPWIAAAFFGDNRIVANSLDRNLVDMLRSQAVQSGGSTLPPGEIPNVISHIQGGVGVFGSLSADTIRTRFERPAAP